MKFVLAAMVCFNVLTYITYKAAARPGDDFGAGVLPFVCGAISIILAAVYAGMALYYRSLL